MEQEAKKKYNLSMGMAEIRTRFQGAADKRQQIKILAECNACSREVIREILIEQGIPEDEIPKMRAPKKKLEEKKSAPKAEGTAEKKPDAAVQGSEKKPDAAVQGIRTPQIVLDLVEEKIDRLMEEILEKEEKLAVLHAFLIYAKETNNDMEPIQRKMDKK